MLWSRRSAGPGGGSGHRKPGLRWPGLSCAGPVQPGTVSSTAAARSAAAWPLLNLKPNILVPFPRLLLAPARCRPGAPFCGSRQRAARKLSLQRASGAPARSCRSWPGAVRTRSAVLRALAKAAGGFRGTGAASETGWPAGRAPAARVTVRQGVRIRAGLLPRCRSRRTSRRSSAAAQTARPAADNGVARPSARLGPPSVPHSTGLNLTPAGAE
ncbi:hypothetical protein AHiyo8_pI68530 (plasmid) [Arthrobacter sp. Hiyo8]|nr:hypothetical protein AHiyo8_pI68530 [Arthrobacter sp. Hiyo8]